MLKKLFAVSILLLITLGTHGSVYHFSLITTSAQTPAWQIDSFNSSINIQQDGRAKISETIKVDFENLQKHGIYRDIPFGAGYDSN